MVEDQLKSQIGMLRTWVEECGRGELVFLGGAGVSTESGIPDFRSVDGLYSQRYDYPPEELLSAKFFDRRPDVFLDFYISRVLHPLHHAKPNAAHLALARLEQGGKLSAVITQNIDGLHQAAGSKNVLELHGSVHRNYCIDCGSFTTMEYFPADGQCPVCGGIVKPDVVLYGEQLDSTVLTKSIEAIRGAKVMIVAGTSLAVYPAAGLTDYFHGNHLVIVNLQPTPQDRKADLCIQAKVGEVLGAL